ncbi:MAG: LysM peptidoglycan-binding domain-containing protein [Phycisphaerales bacterium]
MTREHKLALILGFALVLVVGVLISDHLSGARQATLESILDDSAAEPPLLAAGRPLPTSPQADPGLNSAEAEGDVFASNQTREPESIASAPERPTPPPANIVTGQPIDDERLALADRTDSRPSLSVDELRRYAKEQFGIELTPVTPAVGMTTDGQGRDETREPARQFESPSRRTNYPAPRLHTVQADETLWSIAQRYFGDGALHARLAAYNKSRLPDPSALRVGLTILVPTKDELTSASDATLAARGAEAKPQPSTAAPSQTASKPDGSAREYVVKKGDTLGEISMATLGTSKRWREIYDLNTDRIDDPNNVVVGTRLRLPAK